MRKLRESGLLKFLAGILLGLGLITGIVSGIFFGWALYEDYYSEGGEQRIRDAVIEDISWYYNTMALEYASEYLNAKEDPDYEWSEKFYTDFFAEENINYMFEVKSASNGEEGEVLLSNYKVDDVQYRGKFEASVDITQGSEKISCKIPMSDIVRKVDYKDIPAEIKSGYEGEGLYYYSVLDTANVYWCDYDFRVYQGEMSYDGYGVEDVESAASVDVTEATTAPLDGGVQEATIAATTEEIEIEEKITYDYYEGEDANYYLSENDGKLEVIKEEYSHISVGDSEASNRIYIAYFQPLNFSNHYIHEDMYGNAILVIDHAIEYNLTDSDQNQFVYNNLLEKYKETDLFNKASWDYNSTTGEYVETFYMGYSQPVVIEYSVKSDLTAHDHYAQSYQLKYLTQIFDMAMPVFIICCIVVLITFAYLVWAAGHKKNVEGIYVNGFDKIPYDIVLAVYGIAVLVGLAIVTECGYSIRSTVACSIPLCVVVMLFPVFLVTTATRMKVGRLFKNTVTAGVLKWLFKLLKNAFGWFKSIFSYLRTNVKIYWKWTLVLVAIGILEFIVCAATYNMEFTLMVLVCDFVVVAVVLAIAAINMHKLKEGAKEIASGHEGYKLDTEHMLWEFKNHAETLNNINDGISVAVNERLKSERMQTELITNVTHDIKTPLTSIISYVDLLSKEELNNEKADEYVEVLARQSDRLKKLIQDLIEASKATTGNLKVEMTDVDVKVLLEQSLAEFSDKLEAKGLKPVVNYKTEDTVVKADGKHLWRVFDNLINNISKYAQDNSRVYIDVERGDKLKVSFKNISKDELNISGDELMERFVRGDKSRNTEGNGLGLSIAKSLMKLQDGDLDITIDGDLFKVIIIL